MINIRRLLARASGPLLIVGVLSACSGGGGTDSAAPPAPSPPANNAPTISGTPGISLVAGQAYSFIPAANDADGDTLTFSIANQPSWTNFNVSTGALTGTPTAIDVGTTLGVTISVSDGIDSASLAPFDLEVQPSSPAPNNPPTISGLPATSVIEAQPYSFAPVADDSDGDTLTFSIANQPSWTNFNVSTGALTGTPTAIDVGTTLGVTISVSDGIDSASLAPFDLEVQAIQLGSATVFWDAPLTNADNSPLNDLAGFRVHYGTSPQSYSAFLAVNDPTTTSATISGLTAGTWYFAVTALDQLGNESAFSTEVNKVIP